MNEIKRIIFSGLQILIEKKWVTDQAVVVEENKIKAIIPAEMIRHHLPALHHEFSSDHYLIPGLIDLHVHGANGKDIMDASEEAFMAIRLALAAEGVTGFLATTMTADNERIEAVLKAIPGAMAQEEGAAIYGVHLEGPFISASKSGAQRREDVQVPDISLFQNWQSLANGAIRLVTLAPELPGAIPFIKSLHNMDVITSIGHTNATYEETIAAIAAGCTQATHLFNAMSGLHQRHPGAVGALLLANDVYAEIITDGLHLHPAVVEIALQMKGKDRLLLVTDAMRAKCLGDGHFDLVKEPRRSGEVQTESLGHVARNFLAVASNWRFMLFLIIFSGYYIAFWQEFIILPLYIHAYVNANTNTEALLSWDSLTVIALQMVVSIVTQKMPAFRGIMLGTLISGLAWLLLVVHPSVPMAVATLIVVAIGEITQQPRYYEYISRLAPSGQQGTYMGFAFLPIGIGSLVGGWFGGRLIHHFGEVIHQPALIWWAVSGVGVATAGLLLIYDRLVRRDGVEAI